MTVSNQDINWEALLYALAAQTEPLPDSLHQAHQTAVQASPENKPQAIHALRQHIKQYPDFEAAYSDGLKQATRNYKSQHRTKGMAAALPAGTTLELLLGDIVQTPNPVNAAKRYLQTEQRRATVQKSENAWAKTDRLMVMTAGGVALGTAIARLPGAIIGGLVAICCWYYVSIVKAKSAPRNL
ncbi:MAG: hypothetical protein ACFB14_26415 [Leptolyngbyaceae cyanobacterium]